MSFLLEPLKDEELFSKKEQKIIALIKRRRGQILVHSCVYYRYGDNIWSDAKYDEKAKELLELQAQNPHLLKAVNYENKQFEKWQKAGIISGFDFIYSEHILMLAKSLLEYNKRNNEYKEIFKEAGKAGS